MNIWRLGICRLELLRTIGVTFAKACQKPTGCDRERKDLLGGVKAKPLSRASIRTVNMTKSIRITTTNENRKNFMKETKEDLEAAILLAICACDVDSLR